MLSPNGVFAQLTALLRAKYGDPSSEVTLIMSNSIKLTLTSPSVIMWFGCTPWSIIRYLVPCLPPWLGTLGPNRGTSKNPPNPFNQWPKCASNWITLCVAIAVVATTASSAVVGAEKSSVLVIFLMTYTSIKTRWVLGVLSGTVRTGTENLANGCWESPFGDSPHWLGYIHRCPVGAGSPFGDSPHRVMLDIIRFSFMSRI
jgi:hypothetical protein